MKKLFVKMLADAEVDGIKLNEGTQVKVDETTANDLIDKGLAEDITSQKADESRKAEIKSAVAEAVKGIKTEKTVSPEEKIDKASKVEVKSAELDPCGGYIGTRDKYEKSHVNHAYGLFLKDVLASGTTGEAPSEKLSEWTASCKAAGSGLEVGDDSLGGFLLAPMFSTQFMDAQLENSVVRQAATVISGDARSVQLPMIDGRDHSSGKLFGNMDAFWEAENATLTASRPEFEKPELVKKKLTVLVHVSAEMARWSPMMTGAMLNPMMAQVINWKEDDAFINGDGAGKPLGLLNCPAVESQAKETGQSAATIVYENILNMRSKLWTLNRNAVRWIMNEDLIPQLAQMSLTIGTGGAAVYNPANVAAGQAFDSLMGFPILYTEKCAALGTVGDIILSDLSAYTIFDDARGMDVASSIHIKFLEAQDTLRVLKWVDGQCRVRSAFSPDNGNDKSPIVTLATRA